MKVTLLKEKLKNGLIVTERAIGRNLNLPILGNILLKAEKNFLCLMATDLEIAIRYWILGKVEEEGSVAIPAKILSSYISLIPHESVILTTKNNTLSVEYQNQQSKILGQNAEDFPIIPKVDSESFWEVDNNVFCKSLSRVVDFCSLTQVRPELSGVYFDYRKDQITLAATDSFRLAEKKFYLSNRSKDVTKECSFILPQKAAREIVNNLKELTGNLRIYLSKNQVLFEYPMGEIDHPLFQLTSRLIDGNYPNYQEIVPKTCQTKIIVARNDFINKIRAASLFSGRTNEIQLEINPKSNKFTIAAQNPEVGETKNSIEGEITGHDAKVSFNFRFLLEGLTNFESPDVIFELNGDTGPAVIRPVGDTNYIYVAMPVKTG